MRNKTKLVCGIGVNDADYPVYISATIGGRRNILWACPIYRAWTGMLRRCYSSKLQAKQPTYIGCAVSPEWHSFSAFRGWALTQDWEGNQLDKDLLVPGNKIYSRGTCVFVPPTINNFMTDSGAIRGEWPIGVSWHKRDGVFVSNCSNPITGRLEHLGYFTCPDAAHEAWRARKHELACQYADMQTDTRIAQALRTRYAAGSSA